MRPTTFLLAAFAVAPFASVTAQYPLQAKPGDRVRVTHQCQTWVEAGGRTRTSCRKDTGTLAGAPADSIVLAVDGQGRQLAFPVAPVTRLEVSQGRGSHSGLGAAVGALVGVFAGAVIGYSSREECVSQEFLGCLLYAGPKTYAVVGAMIGGPGGAVAGGLIGATIKTERWQEVPLDRVRASFAPQRDGRFRFGLSVRF